MALTMLDKTAVRAEKTAWPQWLTQEFEQERQRPNGCVGTELLSESDQVRVWTIRLEPGERVGFHRHVLDSGFSEHGPSGAIADSVVEVPGIRLGMKHNPSCPRGPALDLRGLQQRRGDPAPAEGRANRETAELDGAADDQEPARGQQLSILDRDKVNPLRIAAVQLSAVRNVCRCSTGANTSDIYK